MLSRVFIVCAVNLLLSVSFFPAWAAETKDTPPPPATSAVWGPWQILPWDAQPVPEKDFLNASFDITRRGSAGETRHYMIRRINLTVDRQGAAMNRMVAEGQLKRTLVKEEKPGVWLERHEWERFAANSGMTPKEYPMAQEFPGARGLAYDYTAGNFDYVNPPVDFARVGDEMSGYLLKVLTMDIESGDAVVSGLQETFKGKVRIGDTWRGSDWAPWDIGGIGKEGSVGQYQAGEMQVIVAGLTRFHGEAGLLIYFSMENNKVTQKMESPQFKMEMQAIEYFRGQMTVSLRDGRVMGLELWGPLPCTMKMGIGDQPAAEQPIGAIIQEVSVWEVAEAPATPAK